MVHNGTITADAVSEYATAQSHPSLSAEHDAGHRPPAPLPAAGKPDTSQPHWGLWLYATGLSVLLLGVLFYLFLHIPQVPEAKPSLPAGAAADTALAAQAEEARFNTIRLLFVMTMAMTLCCGALGGCLFNMRGLIKHALEKNFEMAYKAAYILQPFAGALSGFIVFLVLVGGLFSMEVQPPHNTTGELDWIILRRQLPFMAFATLAGYASHVFMMKLKDIAEVLFSIPERVNPVTKTHANPAGGTASEGR